MVLVVLQEGAVGPYGKRLTGRCDAEAGRVRVPTTTLSTMIESTRPARKQVILCQFPSATPTDEVSRTGVAGSASDRKTRTWVGR